MATAAVSALTDWAIETLDLGLLVARCHAENLASQRVAERAGYQLARPTDDGHVLWIRRAEEKAR